MIQLLPKLAVRVLPDVAVVILQPVLLHGQPVRLVGAGLGDEGDFEAGFAEDVEGVEGFGYEEACVLRVDVNAGLEMVNGTYERKVCGRGGSWAGDLPVSLPSG
jgi:hypothetical protein